MALCLVLEPTQLRLFVPYLLDMGTVLPYLIPAVLERVIPPESFHDDATNMFIVDKERKYCVASYT